MVVVEKRGSGSGSSILFFFGQPAGCGAAGRGRPKKHETEGGNDTMADAGVGTQTLLLRILMIKKPHFVFVHAEQGELSTSWLRGTS